MIKAVIFDFFGVICSEDFWRFVGADRQLAPVFREHAASLNRGDLHWNDFVTKIAQASHKSAEDVNAMYAHERVNPAMVVYIDKLHKKYNTALISNAHHAFIDPLLKKSGLNNIFDVVTVSSRAGVMKPEPIIYTITLDKLAIKPEQAIYIDDMQTHVDGANKLGMHGVRYESFGQMTEQVGRLLADTDN